MNPSSGGPIEVIKQFEALLRGHGYTTEIASLDSPEEPFLRDLGVLVHPLGSAGGKYGYSRRWVPWLRGNASNYDVVIVNGLWTYNSFGTWRALRGGHTPYMVFTHGMLDPWFKRQYPLKHLKKWLYWPWAEYRVLRDASAVLFTCEEERRLARESFCLYRCNEAIAGLGIASPEGDPSEQQQDFFRHFPSPRQETGAVSEPHSSQERLRSSARSLCRPVRGRPGVAPGHGRSRSSWLEGGTAWARRRVGDCRSDYLGWNALRTGQVGRLSGG